MVKSRVFVVCWFFLALFGTARADVISLTDGTLLEGELVGKDNGIVMFRVNGELRAFPESQVVAILEQDQSPADSGSPLAYTVPEGTRLVINMTEAVNSSRHSVGHQFRAELMSALVVNEVTVIPQGAQLLGTIVEVEQARRLAGRSELAIEFTDIMIDNQLYPIATGDLVMQGQSEGRRTVRRAAGGAILGGLRRPDEI